MTKLTREEIEEARVRLEGWSVPTIDALCDMAIAYLKLQEQSEPMKPAQHPENFMYFDIECQRKGCQALVIEAQAERVERLERRIAQWEGDGIEKDAAIGALQQALRDAYEQCALACIDMPQQGGSTYTYWPCVNAIRALGHAHAQTAATPATGAP